MKRGRINLSKKLPDFSINIIRIRSTWCNMRAELSMSLSLVNLKLEVLVMVSSGTTRAYVCSVKPSIQSVKEKGLLLAYLGRGGLGCVCLLWMIHSEPLIHKTHSSTCTLLSIQAIVCGVVAFSWDIHVHAQSDDSVSTQVKRSLSDRAGVTSSCGELASSHFSALIVKRPVETGSRWWWQSGILRYFPKAVRGNLRLNMRTFQIKTCQLVNGASAITSDTYKQPHLVPIED